MDSETLIKFQKVSARVKERDARDAREALRNTHYEDCSGITSKSITYSWDFKFPFCHKNHWVGYAPGPFKCDCENRRDIEFLKKRI